MKQLLTGIIAVQLAVLAQANTVSIGDPAPELQLEAVLQAPEGTQATLAELKGKVIVLEFWATWCGPCIRAFPHMNELAEAYAGKEIVFLSITSEGKEKVLPFLEKRPLKTWVGLDTDNGLMKHFQFSSIPQTVLIDKQGKVAAITRPFDLQAGHLDTLLAGKTLAPIKKKQRMQIEAGLDPKTQRAPAGVGLLRHTLYGEASSSYNVSRDRKNYSLLNVDLEALVRTMCGKPMIYVMDSQALKGKHFDLIVNLPADRQLPDAAVDLFEQIDIELTIETQSVKSLELSAPATPVVEQAEGREMPIERVSRLLEAYEGLPVSDRSGLKTVRLTGLPKKGRINNLKQLLIDQKALVIEEKVMPQEMIVLKLKK
jgi:thiol-disulfide isomerase/thioredoxin